MNDINRIAIDLAKNVFQVCALNSHNKVLLNKKLSRQKFIVFMAQLPLQKCLLKPVTLHVAGEEHSQKWGTPYT